MELTAGWNEVVLKTTQGNGGRGSYRDFLSPDGKPVSDLVWAPSRRD